MAESARQPRQTLDMERVKNQLDTDMSRTEGEQHLVNELMLAINKKYEASGGALVPIRSTLENSQEKIAKNCKYKI